MRLIRQKPTRIPYSCQVQFGMSGCMGWLCGGEITMRAMGRARSHSSSANTGQTINLSPSGNRNGLRPAMAEYGRRSRGCMSRSFGSFPSPSYAGRRVNSLAGLIANV